MILSIDPGLRGVGWAVLNDKTKLVEDCGYTIGPEKHGRGPSVWVPLAHAVRSQAERRTPSGAIKVVALELPQVYDGAKNQGDPNDLIDLAGVDGAIASLYPSALIIWYWPRHWKGTVPKEIHNKRVIAKLTMAEKLKFVEELKNHNVVDAVGIGCFYLKRKGE